VAASRWMAVAGIAVVAFLGADTDAFATRVPTELAGLSGLQARPYRIGYTGDGTGYLGGFTGRAAVSQSFRESCRCGIAWAGRLHWTVWRAWRRGQTGSTTASRTMRQGRFIHT